MPAQKHDSWYLRATGQVETLLGVTSSDKPDAIGRPKLHEALGRALVVVVDGLTRAHSSLTFRC